MVNLAYSKSERGTRLTWIGCVSGGGHPEQGHCPTGPYKKMIDEVLAKMRVIIVSKQLASHNTKNVSI